jgi:hypothetical protein
MHPVEACSMALIMHQPHVPIHIQASLPLTPMLSMHFFWARTITSLQNVLFTLSFCLILDMVVIYCHLP